MIAKADTLEDRRERLAQSNQIKSFI